MNKEQSTPEQQTVVPAAEGQRAEAQPLESRAPEAKPADPRRRLRELLAIPDRDRSDAIWDEIIGLEIELAPANRAPPAQGDPGRRPEPGRRMEPGRRPEQGRRHDPASGAKPGKRFFRKPRRGPGGPPKV